MLDIELERIRDSEPYISNQMKKSDLGMNLNNFNFRIKDEIKDQYRD